MITALSRRGKKVYLDMAARTRIKNMFSVVAGFFEMIRWLGK
jgi:NADH pyrophosphatase NudC (nudix superfamily)